MKLAECDRIELCRAYHVEMHELPGAGRTQCGDPARGARPW